MINIKLALDCEEYICGNCEHIEEKNEIQWCPVFKTGLAKNQYYLPIRCQPCIDGEIK